MEERLKELRKCLKMNQAIFGGKIGLTASAICNYENGSRSLTEQTIVSICKEYNVSRAWLVEGVGDMFMHVPDTILDELSIQFDLTEEEKELVSDFCKLSKEQRTVITSFLRKK